MQNCNKNSSNGKNVIGNFTSQYKLFNFDNIPGLKIS